ncbi:hypothetical protein PAMA_017393 [Pampus argenteus]
MEGTGSPTARERTTERNMNQEADNRVVMSSKPLHRFIQKEPKSLGIVIVICGCMELLMGFQLASESVNTSNGIYVPFWQGALFLICGNLSIYTEVHPSKKMVTVCLAMYVVSLLGIIVSVVYRIYCFAHFGVRMYIMLDPVEQQWTYRRLELLFGIEGLLFTYSLCVSVLLIFLCVIARLALKSTRTQVIIQNIPPPLSNTTSTF